MRKAERGLPRDGGMGREKCAMVWFYGLVLVMEIIRVGIAGLLHSRAKG